MFLAIAAKFVSGQKPYSVIFRDNKWKEEAQGNLLNKPKKPLTKFTVIV
jgi:hypothetical protein